MLHETRSKPEDWGLTPTQYASREKARLREREKKRRQRAEAARKLTAPSLVRSFDGEVFETASGIRAYRKTVPNRVTVSSSPIYAGTAHECISLPYVSILGSVRPA